MDFASQNMPGHSFFSITVLRSCVGSIRNNCARTLLSNWKFHKYVIFYSLISFLTDFHEIQIFIVEYFLSIIEKPSRRLTDELFLSRYVKKNVGNLGLKVMKPDVRIHLSEAMFSTFARRLVKICHFQ